ncbi:hypothetical protein D1B17_06915 [Companilactobacillus zhachilii]|uniref:Uncharacterized protein n=1 Tax=Companilactobacillus zhachilii TaxID=2304606 RepID=A0A386PV84_9LACO|nr:hypothetical protein D1B17_06915 [Companilactobacillus zhachilii]
MVEGNRTLRNPNIKKQLSTFKRQLISDLYFDVNNVINDYIQQANSDIKDVIDFKTVKKWLGIRFMVVRVKYEDYGRNYRSTPRIDPDTGEQAYYYENIFKMHNIDEIDTSNVKSVRIDKGDAVVEMYDKRY